MSGLAHCTIKTDDGELLSEETIVLGNGVVRSIAKQFETNDGKTGTLKFIFDPPLVVPEGVDT